VQLLGEAARELAVSLIDALKPMGQCDFVEDFSLKMPMELFLRMVDLPSHDREGLISLAATTTHSPDMGKRGQAMKDSSAIWTAGYVSGPRHPATI